MKESTSPFRTGSLERRFLKHRGIAVGRIPDMDEKLSTSWPLQRVMIVTAAALFAASIIHLFVVVFG